MDSIHIQPAKLGMTDRLEMRVEDFAEQKTGGTRGQYPYFGSVAIY